MCGRYTLFTDSEYEDIRKIIEEVERKHGTGCVKTGEIFPTNSAPILLDVGSGVTADVAKWGFLSFHGKSSIINARAETAAEKRMFGKSLMIRRCVVPSTGFYEWDSQKRKRRFQLPGSNTLYMAGLYNDYQGERRYVIMTTTANESIINVHDRMPVIVPLDKIDRWIADTDAAFKIMSERQPELSIT
ncbi:SOS response-associated peptidase [Clostridium sp. D33t1_170424_F3]|uniref:SOS response-associated peptidase n=1 Tax=Clostridium sp. D33t1_170424_F3 TaxID=2787099 RepID=UPI0018AA8492|nr:SOS response-associated peptidase [Clostridium sp. D33t1_170424_F3]